MPDMDAPVILTSDQADSTRRRKTYLQGLLLLLIVVVLWTASNFLTNALLTTGGYDKPFFVTYANTSSFALYLIPYLVNGRLRARWLNSEHQRRFRRAARSGRPRTASFDNHDETWSDNAASDSDDAEEEPKRLPRWLTTLGFDVPTPQPSVDVLLPTADPAAPVRERHSSISATSTGLRRLSSIANEDPRGRRPTLDSTCSTPLLSNSRASSPVRSFLTSQTLARPSSIDGRRPRANITVSQSAMPTIPLVLPPLTFRETAILASQFTIIWFGANWAINAGLGLTSVASGTTIGSASGFFTLALGALLGVDRFTGARLGAVCISALGVFAVTYADSDLVPTSPSGADGFNLTGLWKRDSSASEGGFIHSGSNVAGVSLVSGPPNAPLGDMLALLSAFLYSLYVMLLKTRIGSEDRISMPLMFGIVGLINICCLWPVIPILHFTGIETFALPDSPRIWIAIAVNMSITFVSDFIYLLAMLKSSPLITTLGLSLTIPLAVVIDAVKGSHTGGTLAAAGSALVLSSFAFIGFDDHKSFQREKQRFLQQQEEQRQEHH
ncbi:hypothetical protein BCV70DRAFT_200830 [Testicularia cyperi]|uniref:DUF3955 domain-containing protein n=1 Tax=Testicularia cyperi TaxID=1882483 RepID=A0A317XN22_9BASI|nr:hypothetical protein BCV70DRAFT_200830 [Testicularia cyperi]